MEKYLELQKSSTPNESIFEATTTAIKQQGIRLRSLEEIKKVFGYSFQKGVDYID